MARFRVWPLPLNTWIAIAAAAAAIVAAAAAIGVFFYAKKQVEEYTAPELSVLAYLLRTPVPNLCELRSREDRTWTGQSDCEQSAGAKLYSNYVWHVTIWNDGDGKADSLRVRAPGARFARVGRSGRRIYEWVPLEEETAELGDVFPQGFATASLYLEPFRVLKDKCELGDVTCFTEDDLAVFAANAGPAHMDLVPWDYPLGVRPRWWQRNLWWLIPVVGLLVLGAFLGRRRGALRRTVEEILRGHADKNPP